MNTSRVKAWELCESLGLACNPHLPELENGLLLRSKKEIAQRALALMVCVAVSYGFPQDQAINWLNLQGLWPCLSLEEAQFLESGESEELFQAQVEELYVFAWLLGSYPEIEWKKPIPDTLVNIFPDLKKMESAARFIEDAVLPPQSAVMEALDAAYCLDWAITEQRLSGKRNPLSCSIKGRRKPLEWALSGCEWGEISLDT